MGLDRIFGESVRELADGESKCFQVIPADTKCVKISEADAGRLSHIEIGAGRINLESCPHEDGYIVVSLPTNARFAQFVMSADYLATCQRKKLIIGESGENVEVDIGTEDVGARDSETFKGQSFKIIVQAMMPAITIVSSN
jgi:hypothetical protein